MKFKSPAVLFLSAFLAAISVFSQEAPDSKQLKLYPARAKSETEDKITVSFFGQTKKAIPDKDGNWSMSIMLSADALKLNPLFADNMVLQRDIPAPVWGTAEEGEKITVSFSGQTKEAVADKDGRWMVRLDPLKASSDAQIMAISSSIGNQKLKIENVLIGDVWICSGQSNMAFAVSGSRDSQKEISEADYPDIRSFKVVNKSSREPASVLNGRWDVCSPKTVPGFSAVGYFFGRELYRKLNIPIGLINSSWGGTVAEAWTTWKTLESTPELSVMIEKFKERVKVFSETKEKYDESLSNWTKLYGDMKEGVELSEGGKVPKKPGMPLDPDGQNAPARLYNGMINPLIPFAIKGAIWYQGESNATRAQQYRTLLPALIKDWRTGWGLGDFPFLIVQLANYKAPSPVPVESAWAELREAQYLTSKNVPNSGLATIIDIGEGENIHPENKQDVGLRLSLIARKLVYDDKELITSGPVYESMKVEDGKIRVKFSSVGGGLEARGGELKTFAIAGEDTSASGNPAAAGKKFVWANARIEGDSVVVWSDEVKKPSIVRYAWAENPEGCNLYNKEGLPAVPFRTDAPAEKKKEE